nr:MAG TPA: hypothetical protein [Caudoviricetes sp.]
MIYLKVYRRSAVAHLLRTNRTLTTVNSLTICPFRV